MTKKVQSETFELKRGVVGTITLPITPKIPLILDVRVDNIDYWYGNAKPHISLVEKEGSAVYKPRIYAADSYYPNCVTIGDVTVITDGYRDRLRGRDVLIVNVYKKLNRSNWLDFI